MLKDKLKNFSDQINREKKTSPLKSKNPDRYDNLARSLDGRRHDTPIGTFIKIVTNLDRYYAHGKKMIDDLPRSTTYKKEYFYNCDDRVTLQPSRLLFFDMETTGLGGTGTIPFLIGFGSIKKNGFQVRQYFLPDYPDEEAMLGAVREEIKEDSIIVSYNGKSFDMPILTDRLILHRIERQLTVAEHIDLLYMARRMYRRRLQDCTLINIEANILDFHRDNDVPGYLVPSIFFNWLNYDDIENLSGIIEHNRHDIVSLYFLMHHFAELRRTPEEYISEPDDLMSLAKIFDVRKEHRNISQLLGSYSDILQAYQRFDIILLQSFAYKRQGEFEEAIALWEAVAESGAKESFPALIELAKYYEHRRKDFVRALDYADRAAVIGSETPVQELDLKKRIGRLRRKISKYPA